MKYELGDYVKINKRWKNVDDDLIPGFETTDEFFNYVEAKGIDGIDCVKLRKITCDEKGYICGFRKGIKQSHVLDVETSDEYRADYFYLRDQEYIDVYLVATRMNCIYKVSKEDITLIKDNGGM
jgi:hypothetical protein